MTGLRTIREQHGWTQNQLGNLIDRSGPFIAELELGRKGASVDTLQRLATVLDVSVDALLRTSITEIDHNDIGGMALKPLGNRHR